MTGMKHVLLSLTAGLLILTVQSAFAANTGGYATTDGGDISGAVKKQPIPCRILSISLKLPAWIATVRK